MATESSGSSNQQIIDPNNDMQIGMLIGMMGGTITDAAVLRYALQRFEQTYGRKATVTDVGILAGMVAAK
jgi:hypothetical protein